MHDEIWSLWRRASGIDTKLNVRKRHLPRLAETRVLPRPYSRDVLFAVHALRAGRQQVEVGQRLHAASADERSRLMESAEFTGLLEAARG